MPTYNAPGVYVEEIPSGTAPISGVGTSTCGFIGLVPDNATMPRRANGANHTIVPAGVPYLVTSFTEFTNKFGALTPNVTPESALAHAVRGFFLNGGRRAWVVRVTSLLVPAPPAKDPIDVALTALEGIDEIALVAAPIKPPSPLPQGLDLPRLKAIRDKVLDHCETLQDRFAIIDAFEDPVALTSTEIETAKDTTYGAMYFPWIDVGGGNFAPPSGHVAGMYARVDALRGVHKAPANEVLRGAVGVKYRISKAILEDLNPNRVNAIRAAGTTVKVWGARTLTETMPDFKYISVRRLFLFLRESIDEGLPWVMFEPNAPELWAKIIRNVSAFLTGVWSSGGLVGNSADQAFYVKCDEETNTPDSRDLGQVITEIGVAVVKPAEFVIFRLTQWSQAK